MTRHKPSPSRSRLPFEMLNPRLMLDGTGFLEPVFHGPTPYLSAADTPAGFTPVAQCDACVVGLETFEDNSLDFGLEINTGQIIGPDYESGLPSLTDSVDLDDGLLDGTGQSNGRGYSYFTFGNSLRITLPSLMQSAGLVWTDGDRDMTDVIFEAFDESGNSLGTIHAGPLGDGEIQGTTAEDRFFGISYGDGITTGVTSIAITNVGGLGLEIDHIQFVNCSACCDIDLELTKSVDTTLVESGDEVTWTIHVTNNEADATVAATGVTIRDILPAGMTLLSANASGNGTFAGNTWSLLDPLAPGATETLTLVTSVDEGLAGGTVIVNTAFVAAANELDVDSTPGDANVDEDDADDAAVTVAMQITGSTYVDTNNDGVFQSYELPLMGVEIQLSGTDYLGNTVQRTTFSLVDGTYRFERLWPGTYTIEQTQPVQFVDGKDTLGNLGGDDSVNDQFTVQLTADATDYNFGELGLRPEYVNKRLYLTSTPYDQWEYIDVRQASIWYCFDLAHKAFLDVHGVVNDGSATVEIYDSQMNRVGVRNFGVFGSAFEQPLLLQHEGPYYLQITGDAVIDSLSLDIVSPNVQVDGNQLIAVGTGGDDSIRLQLGHTTHVLDINGLIYEFDAGVVNDLHLGAATGIDSVIVTGTTLDDRASVMGTSGELKSSNYAVHTYAFDNTMFVGGGGYDYSQLYGSLGNDRLASFPGDSTLTTPENVLQAVGFDRVDAYGRGGVDYASLYGTQQDDSFFANDSMSVLRGIGHHVVAKGFQRVDAFGRGGHDTAILVDSARDDVFVSTSTYALLNTGSRVNYVKGFEDNTADFRNGGLDSARFVELVVGNHVQATGDAAEVQRTGRIDRVKHIDRLFAAGLDFGFHVEEFEGDVTIDS